MFMSNTDDRDRLLASVSCCIGLPSPFPAFAISLSSYAWLLMQWGLFNCRVIDSLSKTDLSLFAVCLSVSEFKQVSLVYCHNV